MDYSDDYFDDLMKLSLRVGTSVTPQQKHRAWENLRQAVLEQSFPPDAELEMPPAFGKAALSRLLQLVAWLGRTLMDDEHYYRANHNRRHHYGQWSHGVNMTMFMFSDLRF
jgi:hypothetical protein